MSLLFALLAGVAGVSCGSGLHDGDEEQWTTVEVSAGGSIEFMGAKLSLCAICLDGAADISLGWHRKSDHVGARSAEYTIKVPYPDTFQSDPAITISTTPALATDSTSVIGFLTRDGGEELWIPDQEAAPNACPSSTTSVCGPVQIGSFKENDNTVMRFAIVQKCERTAECRPGESCSGHACNHCSSPSNCAS
jgi:hypothetical protein